MNINELDEYIKLNGHLPGMPSANEVAENEGYEVGNMQLRMLKQTEEQALYIISIKRELDKQKKELAELKAALKQLKK